MKHRVAIIFLSFILINFIGCATVNEVVNKIDKRIKDLRSSKLLSKLRKDDWDVGKLDTARNVAYLSETEKDVILVSNAVRTNPAKFGELYVLPITKKYSGKILRESVNVRIQTEEGVSVVNELYKQLLRLKGMSIQQPLKGLSQAAADHAYDQSLTGDFGHAGSDNSQPCDRMKKYVKWTSYSGENISYGKSGGMEIILQLLIDDGVYSRGHRKNILNPKFDLIGVGIDKHPKYGKLCVLDYAKDYSDSM